MPGEPWFAFLVHPRHVGDIDTFRGASLVRRHSRGERDYVAKICTHPPLIAADICFGAGGIRGEVIAAVRMPEVILTPEGAAEVRAAARLAADRGARVIGLGALTAPATRGGERLVAHVPGATVTNGNAYTAAVVRDNVVEVAQALELARPHVAVVGCTGSVGSLATRLLAAAGHELTLIGPTLRRVVRQFAGLDGQARLSGDVADVRRADVVVLLTGHATARITPAMVRPGTVVVDVAHPLNVPPAEYARFRERGCDVVPGGLVRIPRYSCAHEFYLPDPRDTFACLAETYLFAREGIREHSVGVPTERTAARMERAAVRHGVRPRALAPELGASIRARARTSVRFAKACGTSPVGAPAPHT